MDGARTRNPWTHLEGESEESEEERVRDLMESSLRP